MERNSIFKFIGESDERIKETIGETIEFVKDILQNLQINWESISHISEPSFIIVDGVEEEEEEA